MISLYLTDLESVTIEDVSLSQLSALTKNRLGLPIFSKLKNTRVVKALNGRTKELKNYRQENYPGMTNTDRKKRMLDKITTDGYPFDDKYIVLFNDQNVIRDGQHRAACLYYISEDKDRMIPVIRMRFKNGKYCVFMHPWIQILFFWDRKRIKSLVRKLLRLSKIVLKLPFRLLRKIKGLLV